MNPAKRKGLLNEWRSRDLLIAAGYKVTRAGGSLGAWDLIGISATEVVLVQVKTRAWPGSFEMTTMRRFPAPRCCRKIIHRWRRYARQPDVKEV